VFSCDAAPVVPLSLAVVQPTPFCNIDCRYCYLPERLDRRRMSLQTAEHVFKFLFANPDRLAREFTVAWHGGEPTTVPVDFFEAAFARMSAIKPAGVRVANKFTTNGTLLDDEWCSLFRRWQVALRVSIDGPRWLHDRERVDRMGRGTFHKVMAGIERLRAAGLDFHTIAVLRDESLDHAEEMWTFFRDIGSSGLEFCTEESLVVHTHGSNSLAALARERTCRRMQAFFETLMRLRDRDAPGFYIREIDTVMHRIRTRLGRHVRGFETEPFSILSITWDGRVSTFSPELVEAKHHKYGNFVFGHVATDTWDDVLNNPVLRQVYRDITEGVNACARSCAYFDLCGGDSPAAKLFENDSFESTDTLYCQLRVQALGELLLQHLRANVAGGDAEAIGAMALPRPAAAVAWHRGRRPTPLPEEHTS
jgi:uncharacterized protein